MTRIFKILRRHEWQAAVSTSAFLGSEVDLRDGYIHFSDTSQVAETAARHFSGQKELVLAAFEVSSLGDALKWETSRNGQLFPHLYATLDPALSVGAWDLPWDGTQHRFPQGVLP